MSGIKRLVQKSYNYLTKGELETNKHLRGEADRAEVAEKKDTKNRMFANAQMPDSDALRRTARRKAARRPGSRVSTILTDLSDRLGPG